MIARFVISMVCIRAWPPSPSRGRLRSPWAEAPRNRLFLCRIFLGLAVSHNPTLAGAEGTSNKARATDCGRCIPNPSITGICRARLTRPEVPARIVTERTFTVEQPLEVDVASARPAGSGRCRCWRGKRRSG